MKVSNFDILYPLIEALLKTARPLQLPYKEHKNSGGGRSGHLVLFLKRKILAVSRILISILYENETNSKKNSNSPGHVVDIVAITKTIKEQNKFREGKKLYVLVKGNDKSGAQFYFENW